MRHYLVVDDNLAFADNLAEILRDAGAEVVTAAGGAHALRIAAVQKFDALITDMRMPSMSGAALVHEILRVDPGLPAIVITAYTGEDDLAAARYEGLLAILPKPAPITQLLDLLAAARRDGLVAVVDDDRAVSECMAEALRQRGFSAVMAHSVVEIDRLGSVRLFAALVDLRMPGGTDGEALRRLKARFPLLPMLILTGHHQGPPSPLVFLKPFDTARVMGALEAVYDSAESQQRRAGLPRSGLRR